MTRDLLPAPAERWLPVIGFEGLYEVSNHGRVRRLNDRFQGCSRPLASPALITPKRSGKYWAIDLARGGRKRRVYVHIIVLTAFVGPAPLGHEGAHDDGDGSHNALSNLIWKTRSDNHLDKRRHGTSLQGEASPHAKLTTADIPVIRACGGSLNATGKRFGVSAANIKSIREGRSWSHVT